MRVWRIRYPVFVVAGLICLGVQFGDQVFSARAQSNQTAVSKALGAKTQQSNGFYFGSSTTKLGRRAWFLQLDLVNRRGKLFMRPDVLNITNVKVTERGHITFRTEADLGDVIYQFEGDEGLKGITGRFDSIRADPDTAEELLTTDSVVLEKITLPTSNPQSSDVSGVYSNVRYNTRSGDLNGQELILFRRGNSLHGIFINYEDMEPLAVGNVSLSGPNLSFRVVSLAGELTYSGRFSGNKIHVRRSDTNASPSLSSEVLLREGDVRSVFKKQTGSTRP